MVEVTHPNPVDPVFCDFDPAWKRSEPSRAIGVRHAGQNLRNLPERVSSAAWHQQG